MKGAVLKNLDIPMDFGISFGSVMYALLSQFKVCNMFSQLAAEVSQAFSDSWVALIIR